MNILIITHSSTNGINFKQAEECMNIISDALPTAKFNMFDDPTEVHESDISFADKIIMIVPEWNASFPYSFKKMIDDSGHPSSFYNKEILLIGTSNTTFGNILGITHLKTILEWIGALVSRKMVSLPNIDSKFSGVAPVDERFNKTILSFIGDC